MIVSVPKYKPSCFPENLNVDKCQLGRCSALFASLVYLKGLLISPTFQTEAITSFNYVIGLKHVVMLTDVHHPLHKKIPRMNFFILNIHFRG